MDQDKYVDKEFSLLWLYIINLMIKLCGYNNKNVQLEPHTSH